MNASKLKLAGSILALNMLVGCGAEEAVAGPGNGTAMQAEIEQLLGKYEVALNANDVQSVLKVFGSEPVVMTAEHPAAVGAAAVEGFYTATFQAIDLNLKFKVAEVKSLGTDWAMVRSTSTGIMKINANGAEIPSAFQELFIVHKEGGKWKFARYFFSSTQAAAK
jgi:uncharacterized protein (TIGR02246 family)